jgi:quinoprotein glucose dehydrogenase
MSWTGGALRPNAINHRLGADGLLPNKQGSSLAWTAAAFLTQPSFMTDRLFRIGPGCMLRLSGGVRREYARLCVTGLLLAATGVLSAGADRDWGVYLGDKASTQFSDLAQINRTNVQRLDVAWTFRSGDSRQDNRSQIQCNPLVIGGVLYGTSPQLKLLALNAANGRELWRFDPFAGGSESSSLGVNRGVVYWADKTGARILFTAGHYLYAINAASGRPILDFGNQGRVDIRENLGRDPEQLFVLSNTPGVIYRDKVILGTRVSEGPGPAAPGDIRAYDVRTGKLAWSFRTIPHPGEPGYETWPPDAWRYIGGANCWAGMAVDEARGLVFCPTGSASFDFWGGNRIGQNLFANCLLALDAETGRRVWHYQFVHHDLWDRDLPAPPNLVTLRRDGRLIDAVAQVTKSGHIFVFNRETGEPLFPIEDRIVPPSDLDGESAWPTQPLPVKPEPFARQLFSADQINDLSPESYRAFLNRFIRIRPHVPFLPPSTEGTIIFPGFDGGAEWGGAGVDPRRGILYVNSNEMPWILTMVPTRTQGEQPLSSGHQIYNQICAACHGITRAGDPTRAFPTLVDIGQRLKKAEIIELLGQGRGNMPGFAFLNEAQREAVTDFLLAPDSAASRDLAAMAVDATMLNEPYTHTGYNRWLDTNGYPAVKPPWGTLNAIDLNTGEYLWRTTLGEFPDLTAKGIPPTGTENYGGPVVTAGGLIFIAASKDEMIRAFDKATGKVLWQAKLPAGGYATPATYMLGGRQYIVIACGGGKMGTKSGDAYVAFALPEPMCAGQP